MTSTRVSVILPTCNGARTVVRAIRSVTSQLRDDDELVVVDDGSRDTTAALVTAELDDLPMGRGRLISRETSGGPAEARNAGLAAAKGAVIMSIDHDDEWASGHVSLLLQALDHADIAVGMQTFHVTGEDVTDTSRTWWREEWLTEPQDAFVFGGSAIRRECLDQVGLLDPALRFGCDDVDWFARAQSLGVHIARVPEVVLFREIHDRNLSADPGYHRELLTVVRRHAQRRSDED